MNEKKIAYQSIEATKKSFEESFSNGAFYDRQTQDEEHLQKILSFLPVESGMKILDLGTGSGYLTFSIAKAFPDTHIIGLDIVEQTLCVNRQKAKNGHFEQIKFISYNGIDFPFESEQFDLVVTRYALHHFPEIQTSISEVSRVLKPGGFFFISDPAPNPDDTSRFVDEYMQLKKDGHIRFYTKEDWNGICRKADLIYSDSFGSQIRFPKKRSTANGFDELLKKHDPAVIEGYQLEITEDEIYLTERVNNILFQKR